MKGIRTLGFLPDETDETIDINTKATYNITASLIHYNLYFEYKFTGSLSLSSFSLSLFYINSAHLNFQVTVAKLFFTDLRCFPYINEN